MKLCIAVLALIGFASSFTPGKEYTYKYKGRLGMGMPSIKNTVSGTGIKCDVIFQVSNGGKAMVKFSNVEVGEYLGEVDCNMATPMPIQYSPLKGYATILEEPFEVHFKSHENEVMIVPKSDLTWIVNLRKSISLMFFMVPLKMNFETYRIGDPIPKSFSQFEETIHGNCKTEYTLMPMVDSINEDKKSLMLKQMMNDIEFKDVTDEPMYKMVRNIDFNDCKDRVVLMRAGFGNFSNVATSQLYNIKSRVSITTLNLVGKPGSFRVQTGFVQGSTLYNSYGLNTDDKLTTITNQTISLISVTEIKNPMTLATSTRSIKTWLMEADSPFAPPPNPAPWMNYHSMAGAAYAPFLTETSVTGIPITASDIQKFSGQMESMINEAATKMMMMGGLPAEKTDLWNTNEGVIMFNMDTATKIVPGIDVDTLQMTFDKFFTDKSEIGQMKFVLFVDICAASGAGSPTKMLLNNFKNGKLSDERIASIFLTFANHFTAVPLIPEIMEYVKTFDLKVKPFFTSMIWMNFARTINKFCDPDPKLYHFTTLYFGNQKCDSSVVFDDLLNFFSQKIDTVETSWEKTVLLQAISNLGYPKSMSIFKKVIKGNYEMIVKRSAIYALTPENVGESSRSEVFKALMPLVDDFTAETILRQMALTTLITWGPSPSFWQRLAVNSWKEPSKVMGAFVYQMMKENANMKSPLVFGPELTPTPMPFLLPFTKPYSQSPTYGSGFFRKLNNKKEKITSKLFWAMLKDDKNVFPVDILHYFMTTYGEAPFTAIKAALFMENDSSSVQDIINGKSKEFIPENMKQTTGGTTTGKDFTKSIIEMIQNIMPMMMEKGSFKHGNFFMQLFEHIQIFVPVNMDTLSSYFVAEGMQFIESMISGRQMHFTKYFNPNPIEVFTPTDLGLPLVEKSGMPIMNSAEGMTKINLIGVTQPSIIDLLNANNIGVELNTNYKFAVKTINTFCTIVPWSEKTISIGTESIKNINLPGIFNMNFQNKNNIKNITVGFTPGTTKQFVGVNFQNIPYVMIRNMYPGQHYTEFEKFEVITVKGQQLGQMKQMMPFDKVTYGINGFTKFESDLSYPFTLGNMINYLKEPVLVTKLMFGPSPRLWSTIFVFDFDKSETKSMKTSIAFTWPSNVESNKAIPKTMKWKDFQELNKYPNMFTMYFNTLLEGNVNRFFEMSFKMMCSKDATKQTDIFWTFNKSGISQYKVPPMNYCLKMTATTPLVNDFQTFLNTLKSNKMSMAVNGVLRGGKNCQDGQIAAFKGQMKMATDRRDQLVKELQEKCDFDVKNPVASFKTAPVYDQFVFMADYKEPFPDFAMNTTYQLYDWMKGYYFPHVYSNYMHVKNKPTSMSITGNRIMGDDLWAVEAALPKENVVFDRFKFPIVIDELVPLV